MEASFCGLKLDCIHYIHIGVFFFFFFFVISVNISRF